MPRIREWEIVPKGFSWLVERGVKILLFRWDKERGYRKHVSRVEVGWLGRKPWLKYRHFSE